MTGCQKSFSCCLFCFFEGGGGGGGSDSLWSGELSNFQTRLRGSKTKEMNYLSLNLNVISFFAPLSFGTRSEFLNISKLAYNLYSILWKTTLISKRGNWERLKH